MSAPCQHAYLVEVAPVFLCVRASRHDREHALEIIAFVFLHTQGPDNALHSEPW